MLDQVRDDEELRAWLTEHDRALDRLRARAGELQHKIDAEREVSVASAVAAAGVLVVPLTLALPWLAAIPAGNAWPVLLSPQDTPVVSAAAYAVLLAAAAQAFGLASRRHVSAVLAAIVSTFAGLALVGALLAGGVGTAGGTDADVVAFTGPVICLGLELVLAVLWGCVAESRRWT